MKPLSAVCPQATGSMWRTGVKMMACEGQELHLTCPEHTSIELLYADVGRWNKKSLCSHEPNFNYQQCSRHRITQKINQLYK